MALMRYAALTSLSRESTGRKVKIDDNERSPNEWQIDRVLALARRAAILSAVIVAGRTSFFTTE